MLKDILKEKFSEVIRAIFPVVAIVLILSVTIVPMPTHVVMVFLYSCILLMIGMVFFTIGSEQAMEPMGNHVGTRITKTRKLWLILPLGFLLGFMITISEPDLQVLAQQVPDVPNEKNLAVRAARALQKACGVSRGVRIRIVKRIPAGAGLGGGSADAAAVLNGLNELWGLGLSTERLCAVGAEVGSDVPALVLGGVGVGLVMMEGRGERVRAWDAGETPASHLRAQRPATPIEGRPATPIEGRPATPIEGRPATPAGGPRLSRPFDENFVLRIPDVNASTARVYAEFREEDRGMCRNDLQPAACRLYPVIAKTIAEMEAEGLEGVQMSGSGSAVFGWRKK